MFNKMQSVDKTQIRNLSPCLLMYRMFLLQQGINHTRKTKARRIKNVAERFTKIGKLERISNALRDTSMLAQQADDSRQTHYSAGFVFIDVHSVM